MSAQTSKTNLSTASNAVAVVTRTTALSHNDSHGRRRMAQNYLLVWLDVGIDQTSKDFQNTFQQLQNVVNDVHIFIKPDECIDFITELEDTRAFLIVGDTIGQQMMSLIHDVPQLDGIYVVCETTPPHEQWTKKWTKVKGVYTTITPIFKALQLAVKQCNQDSIAISFVTLDEAISSENLNQLEPTFMYTQIFKEILLQMEYNQQSIDTFIQFWRQDYIGNTTKMNDIAEFELSYSSQSSVYWYTREYFIYQMLNQALRTLKADIIINMGFFIHDLHHEIKQLHQQQVSSYKGKPFKVYRGQGLSKTDFEKLLKTKGGLMSFNNFLSTSTEQEVSHSFAQGASTNPDLIGILFVMSIDPSISSTPFATIRDASYYKTEEEILFSMHTVFRVGEIKQLDNNRLYQVELQLTADDDEELRMLTNRIREEAADDTGWERLGRLLIRIGQFAKAEELYNVLLEQTSDEGERALYYNQLGYVKDDQGDYERAIWYYEKSLEIRQILPANDLLLPTSYNNIGEAYRNMGKYSKALSFYEKSLEIQQKTLSANHPDLATSYNNIGLVYGNMGECSKALLFYEKALEICLKTLPANDPLLATSYNNIGEAYRNMGKYSKALSFYEKSLEIKRKTLLADHPSLATSYKNIGLMYDNMEEYSESLSYFERALDIKQRSLPANHPSIQNVKESIEIVRKKL